MKRDEPDRLPTPTDMESGKVEVQNTDRCPVCEHTMFSHFAGYCIICKAECS